MQNEREVGERRQGIVHFQADEMILFKSKTLIATVSMIERMDYAF